MNKYEMIYESICDLYNEGILTEEEAEELNTTAYKMYLNEEAGDINDFKSVSKDLNNDIKELKSAIKKKNEDLMKEKIDDAHTNLSKLNDIVDNIDITNKDVAKAYLKTFVKVFIGSMIVLKGIEATTMLSLNMTASKLDKLSNDAAKGSSEKDVTKSLGYTIGAEMRRQASLSMKERLTGLNKDEVRASSIYGGIGIGIKALKDVLSSEDYSTIKKALKKSINEYSKTLSKLESKACKNF